MRPRSKDPKLIIRVINFELVQPICSAYRNVTDGQTDRRMDGRTTYDSNTALALRASRGKNQTNMNINEGNIGYNIYISSTTRISPLEDQNFPPGGNFPPVGNHWYRVW